MRFKKRLHSIILSSLLLAPGLNALTNASDFSVDKSRKNNTIEMLKHLNYLTRLTVRYVNKTLDTTPTRGEIENYFNLKDNDIFKNFRGENCLETDGVCDDNTTNGIALVFDTTNNRLEFQNVMGDVSTLASKELDVYQDYKSYDGIAQLSADKNSVYFDFLNFPSLENTLLTLQECNDNPQLTCSVSEPADTTQYWKKPIGNGEFYTHHYDNTESKWINKSLLASVKKETLIYDSSNFDKNTTPGVAGDSIIVKKNNKWAEYVHDGEKWVEKSSSSDIPDITASIDPLLNRGPNQWYDADIDTEITVTNLFSNSAVKFVKKTDYWQSSVEVNVPNYNSAGYTLKYIYITHDVTLLPSESTNAIAYSTQNNDGAGFEGSNQKFEFFYDGAKWQNTVFTLEELLLNANESLQDGAYWVMSKYSIFSNQGYAIDSSSNTFTYWTEDKGGQPDFIAITRGDRTDLPSPTDTDRISITYILGNEDTYSTDGLNSSYEKEDGTRMKYWLFTTSTEVSKKVNDMTDHQGECASLSECRDSGKEVALFQDELIALTGTGHWQKPDGSLYPKCKVGFIWIPETSPAMCAAKYEMTPYNTSGWARQYDGYRYDSPGSNTNVTSKSGQNPITYASTNDARYLCSSKLVDNDSNTISGGTSMTWSIHKKILRDLALNPANWSGGAIESGYIYSGHNDNSPAMTIPTSSDDSDGYFSTGNSSPSNQKRTHQFSNGEIIWDYAGNVWEVMYETQNVGGSNGWEEYTDAHTNPFEPQNIVGSEYNWSSGQGIGQKVYAGTSNLYESNIGTGSYWLLSSGYWYSGSNTGLFASYWHANSASHRSGDVGFRCIYPAE